MTNTATLNDPARAVWAAGDYDAIADLIWDGGPRIVCRLGVTPGRDVLDVACGTGNAAIRAAQAGARVVGVDTAPELFAVAGTRAAPVGVKVDWCTATTEALPFADSSFDVVVSTFGR